MRKSLYDSFRPDRGRSSPLARLALAKPIVRRLRKSAERHMLLYLLSYPAHRRELDSNQRQAD